MAKTPRSRKEKGNRKEREIAKRIEDVLGPYGIEATRMLMSGSVDRFKGDIFTNLPVGFEVKNQERLNFWKAWEQCRGDTSVSKIPIVVASKNNYENLALLSFEDLLFFMELALQAKWMGRKHMKRKA